MSYPTQTTVWPQHIRVSDEMKALITLLYELIDDKGPDSGFRLATEVFNESGIFAGGTGTFVGAQCKSLHSEVATFVTY